METGARASRGGRRASVSRPWPKRASVCQRRPAGRTHAAGGQQNADARAACDAQGSRNRPQSASGTDGSSRGASGSRPEQRANGIARARLAPRCGRGTPIRAPRFRTHVHITRAHTSAKARGHRRGWGRGRTRRGLKEKGETEAGFHVSNSSFHVEAGRQFLFFLHGRTRAARFRVLARKHADRRRHFALCPGTGIVPSQSPD